LWAVLYLRLKQLKFTWAPLFGEGAFFYVHERNIFAFIFDIQDKFIY